MRGITVVASVVLTAVVAPGAALAGCKDEVRQAFEKQIKLPSIRMSAEQPGGQGVSKITLEYKGPDRFRQVVLAAGETNPVETQAVANRAWANQGGGWNELLPNFAGSIAATLRSQLVEIPPDLGDFECLNKVKVDGTEYIGYRSINANKGEGQLVRSIYVDEKTGLPALNIVADAKDAAKTIFKGTYTYPTDVEIEPIDGAPVADYR